MYLRNSPETSLYSPSVAFEEFDVPHCVVAVCACWIVVVYAMHGRDFQCLLREAPELIPNLRIGVSLRDMTLIEGHVKRVTELLQSPTGQ